MRSFSYFGFYRSDFWKELPLFGDFIRFFVVECIILDIIYLYLRFFIIGIDISDPYFVISPYFQINIYIFIYQQYFI